MDSNMVAGHNTFPRIIKFITSDEIENNVLKITDKIVTDCETEISSAVRFHLPNGEKFNVHYNKTEQTFTNVGQMYQAVKKKSRLILVLCCKGESDFLVHVFNDGFTEYEYESIRNITRAPFNMQDDKTGIGWNFLSLSIGTIQTDGGVIIPHRFMKWFGENIPNAITIAMENGEVIQGYFSRKDKKIYGLLPLIKKQYVKLFDILIFTYYGENRLEVCIFDRSKIERKFGQFVQVNEPVILETDNDEDREEEDISVQEIDDNDGDFEVGLTTSNVDYSSHGVYIPRNITPINRNWKRGEEISLRTIRGYWTVGLVLNRGQARLSAGWNKFVKNNNIVLSNTLHFTPMGENQGLWMFDVEIR